MDQKFKLGIVDIDEQHEDIEKSLIALQDAIENDGRWHVLHFILEDLNEKLKFHFSLEETVMHMFAYPKQEEHCQFHRKVLESLEKYKNQKLVNTVTGKPPVEFFYEQILAHDLHFVEFIKDIKKRAGVK